MGDNTSSTSVSTTPTIQPWENSSSPYFLSNSDNPGVSLVVQHLTEENYSTWSRAVLIALDAKTKLGFIDGSIPKPEFVDHPPQDELYILMKFILERRYRNCLCARGFVNRSAN